MDKTNRKYIIFPDTNSALMEQRKAVDVVHIMDLGANLFTSWNRIRTCIDYGSRSEFLDINNKEK